MKYYKEFENLFNVLSANDGDQFNCSTLIFQHFPSKLLLSNDPSIRNFFRDHNKSIMNSAYKDEINNSIKQMTFTLIKNPEDIYKNRYSEYLLELQNQELLEKDH
jgi:hypothetical protein